MSSKRKFTFAISSPDELLVLKKLNEQVNLQFTIAVTNLITAAKQQ